MGDYQLRGVPALQNGEGLGTSGLPQIPRFTGSKRRACQANMTGNTEEKQQAPGTGLGRRRSPLPGAEKDSQTHSLTLSLFF